MPLLTSDTRFFGIDLNAMWREVSRTWRQALRSPPLAWLSPPMPVTLLHAGQGQSVWAGDEPAAAVRATRNGFVAVELPEDMILRRLLRIPAMGEADLASAAELEARTNSPFAAHELAWGYRRVQPPQGGMYQIEIAMASRSKIAQYLAAMASRLTSLGGQQPEVWVRSSTQALPIILSGYGEARRYARQGRWQAVGHALLALGVVLLCGMAVTPTAQLRLRAIEAVHAYDGIAHRTAPTVGQREALMQSVEKLDALSHMLASRIEPLKVLDRLTKVLPDDTAIQTFKLQGAKVTIAGDTGNASTLLQKLGEQPGLSDVKAPTAAVRVLGAPKESYSIEFTVDPQVFGMPIVALASAPVPVPAPSAPVTAASTASAPAAMSANAPAQPQAKPGAPAAASGGRAVFGGTRTASPPVVPASTPAQGRK